MKHESSGKYDKADLFWGQAIVWFQNHASGATSGGEGRRYMAELAELEMRRGSMRARRSPKSNSHVSGTSDDSPREPDPDPEPGDTSDANINASAQPDKAEDFRRRVGERVERGKELSLRGTLQTLAGLLTLGGVGSVLAIKAFALPSPGLPWHMLWWSCLLVWLGLLFPAALMRHFQHRPVGNLLATLFGGILLIANPAFTGLTLGAAAWIQGAEFDAQLADEGEETLSLVTQVKPLGDVDSDGSITRFVFAAFTNDVTYNYTVDGKAYEARAIYDRALSSAEQGPAPLPNRAGRTVRYLPSNPWIHQPQGNSFVDSRLKIFTMTSGALVVFIFGVGGWLRLSERRKKKS